MPLERSGQGLFLLWLAFMGLLFFDAVLMWQRGLWYQLVQADPTCLTIVIVLLFVGSSLWVGSSSQGLTSTAAARHPSVQRSNPTRSGATNTCGAVISPARNHPGAIYIWVHPMKDNQLLDMPRVHRLPFEKDLPRILGDGIKKARDGNTQMGSTEPLRGASGLAWLRPAGNDRVQIKLTDLPRAQLPEK